MILALDATSSPALDALLYCGLQRNVKIQCTVSEVVCETIDFEGGIRGFAMSCSRAAAPERHVDPPLDEGRRPSPTHMGPMLDAEHRPYESVV